ncbi:MAG: response regulator [Ignavibacteriales bacterium]|nr:response regulator [Ignavibacteriales bacterium]
MESENLTILLVDDVQENLDLLEEVLGEHQYRVIGVTSGAEALECLRQQRVHLIVSDAMMPKMDGFQLCKKIRQDSRLTTIPFIIYTGDYVDEEDEHLGKSVGVDKYVIKYAGLGSLIEAVNELTLQRYGYQQRDAAAPQEELDEGAFLERHHILVTKKLEEKMHELEVYAGTLSRKNKELEISEDRYRTLFENASIAIFVIDGTMKKILDVNKQGIALLGYQEDELFRMPGLPFVAQFGAMPQLLQENEIVSHEAAMKTKRGEVITVEVSAAYVEQPNDTRMMLFIHDITEKKRMREQMVQIEKMTLMGRLAAGIAHEIRNPLAGVTLNLQYLQRKTVQGSPDSESIAAALEGAQRIQHVIEDTLGLARVTPPTLHEESINSILTRSLSFLVSALKQKHVTIKTDLASDLPHVRVDFKQIQQVLLNVLQNAIDASPLEGVVTVRTRTIEPEELKSNEKIGRVEISIHDQGEGLPPEVAAHLFEPFRTTKVGGTGLGLAITKYIVDRHQGEISLSSYGSAGTIARILFPIVYSISGGSNG